MNNKEYRRILEIGAGKISKDEELELSPDIIYVNVDRNYYPEQTSQINYIEKNINVPGKYYADEDIFSFMDSFKYKFDEIIANRIFEHMEYIGENSVGRLLEACNMLLEDDGELNIIVPNADLLSKMVLQQEDLKYRDSVSFQKRLNDILIINTEFTNSGSGDDFHKSVWSPELAKVYIESEGVWEIKDMKKQITYAGRDIYMSLLCVKK